MQKTNLGKEAGRCGVETQGCELGGVCGVNTELRGTLFLLTTIKPFLIKNSFWNRRRMLLPGIPKGR